MVPLLLLVGVAFTNLGVHTQVNTIAWAKDVYTSFAEGFGNDRRNVRWAGDDSGFSRRDGLNVIKRLSKVGGSFHGEGGKVGVGAGFDAEGEVIYVWVRRKREGVTNRRGGVKGNTPGE